MYRAHVDQRLPYDTLHLHDASMSSMIVYVYNYVLDTTMLCMCVELCA
jgi:hypothetical protein